MSRAPADYREFIRVSVDLPANPKLALVERIVGTGDPDLLVMLREAKAGKPGRPRTDEKMPAESAGNNDGGEGRARVGRSRAPIVRRRGIRAY